MVVPRGKATKRATADVTTVPVTNGMIPYRGFSNKTVHCVSVRKSNRDKCLKKFQDSKRRIPTIPNVMATDDNAQRNIENSIARSRTFWIVLFVASNRAWSCVLK